MRRRTELARSLRWLPASVAGFTVFLWTAFSVASGEPRIPSPKTAATPRSETSSPRTIALDAVARTSRVQLLVDDFRARLSIPNAVVVSIVAKNALVVSVERIKDQSFALSLEDGFLTTLTDDEAAAVVAHELGHVWIFTHHPYLQTEESANRIALELVSRDTLDRVYGKAWTHVGSKGRLTYFHGE